MESLESLGRRIATTRDLQEVARTMKTLSAVSIRQYENAVTALRQYSRSISLALQAVQACRALDTPPATTLSGGTAAVVFGSDHGLCGRFNELITDFAMQGLADVGETPLVMAVGARARARLEAIGERVDAALVLPGSVSGLVDTAHAVLLKLDEWRAAQAVERAVVFHNSRREPFNAVPTMVQLLPLERDWLVELSQRPWPSRSLPLFTMDTESLFAALVRQHLFVTVYRAGAESLASEHASRLVAMQSAEHNIHEHLDELNAQYRRIRQAAITDELLDVIAGFEVLQEHGASSAKLQ